MDAKVDAILQTIGTAEALALRGKTAIVKAKVVYRRFTEILHGEVFIRLKRRRARVQRPLWASTGTKNPQNRDVMHLEELIGSETVTTPSTLDAFHDHGHVRGATVT